MRARRLLALFLVAGALLALGAALDGWLPGDDDDPGSEPFLRPAAVGEPVQLTGMTVEVDSVQGSTALDDFGTELASPGVWVLVRYTVTPTDETDAIGFAQVVDDRGRTWSQQHGRSSNTCPVGPPGVRVGCVASFEVPSDAVDGLRIRLAPELEQRYGAVADVDLGLTDDDAAAFSGAPALEVPETTIGDR